MQNIVMIHMTILEDISVDILIRLKLGTHIFGKVVELQLDKYAIKSGETSHNTSTPI